MDWNNLWAKVKDYIGIGLTNVKEAAKNVEVGPPDAPDLHDVVAKKEKKPRKTTKKKV